MKRRYPIPKLKKFLEHLESNLFNPQKRRREVLDNSFPPREHCKNLIDLCKETGYIKRGEHVANNEKYPIYSITIEGIKFLEEIRRIEREKEQYKLQERLVFTSIIIALSSAFGIVNQFEFDYKSYFQIFMPLLILGLTIKILYDFIFRR